MVQKRLPSYLENEHKYEHKNFARENYKSKVALLQFVYLCAKYWQIIYAETQDSSSNFEFTAIV